MYFAIFGVIKNQYDKILGVSRKDNLLDFGLPGGKVEENETDNQALVREIQEETGLKPINWILIHEDFRNEKMIGYFYISKYEGKIQTNESGLVKWLDKKDFSNEKCTFRGINSKVLGRLE